MFPYLTVVIVLVLPEYSRSLLCSRYPANTITPKSPVDENYVISITGNPSTYILGQTYNVTLNSFNGLKFISFMLALENDNGDTSYNDDLGHFELPDTVDTRFSAKCVNIVENTNTNPKTSINVEWTAPSQPGSGCILIRATLLQHRDVWYMDDGGLTKRICEEVVDDVESAALLPKLCCACDEARYELTFEGIWSRNLHPKDFPAKGWIARFSDFVGTAHTNDYRFWEHDAVASRAMKQFAEHGSSQLLEKEFVKNFKNGRIRTIIKARGLSFPNLHGQSVASVRVDPRHHLLSLASKIEPSPDWVVGVSGLELCMTNCTWLEYKVVNLYPWDVGTDAGPTYTSPDQPQVPSDVIRRMRSDYPNDPRSPFYDESGAPMKPFATLTIKRQRLYERLCQDEDSNNQNVPRECVTHPWSDWSDCSAACGEGTQFRSRVYKQPEVAKIFNCDFIMKNREDRSCIGQMCTEAEHIFSTRPDSIHNDNTQLRDKPNYGDVSGRINRIDDTNNPYEESFRNPYKKTIYRIQAEQEETPVLKQNEQDELFSFRKTENEIESNIDHDNSRENGVLFTDTVHSQENTILEQNKNFDLKVADLRKLNLKVSKDSKSVNTYEAHFPLNYKDLAPLQSIEGMNSFGFSKANGNSREYARCFQQLRIFTCNDTSVAGNFWFYNYCEDECMLYTADICDRNSNRFASLEQCELICRDERTKPILKRKQLKRCVNYKLENVPRKRNKRMP